MVKIPGLRELGLGRSGHGPEDGSPENRTWSQELSQNYPTYCGIDAQVHYVR
jgi:hypothetical protein